MIDIKALPSQYKINEYSGELWVKKIKAHKTNSYGQETYKSNLSQ